MRKFISNIFALNVVLALMPMAMHAQDATNLSEGEAVARLERSLLYNKQIEEGDQLFAAGEFSAASVRYKRVIEATESEPSFRETLITARKKQAQVSAYQSAQAEKKKDYPVAKQFIDEAVELDPSNQTYRTRQAAIAGMNKDVASMYPGNEAVTEELQNKIAKIQRLMFEGDAYLETGQYQRAIGRYNEVILMDPYNDVAQKRIEKVEKLKYKAASIRRDARKEKMLNDVQSSWSNRPRVVQNTDIVSDPGLVEQTASVKILDKLENIRIPELNFTEVDIADAVRFLEDQSKALDPEKEGVNFVLKAQPTMIPSVDGGGEGATPPPPSQPLSLSLKDMPLIEVLNFIKSLTNLTYKVDEYAVYLYPSNETSEVLIIRSFSVPPSFFPATVNTSANTTGDFTTRTTEIATVPVKEELEKRGVKFPTGASAAYLPRTAKLVVKNTLDQLNLIDQLLTKNQNLVKQIEVEAKFIEFTEDKYKQLSSNIQFSNETIPGFTTFTPDIANTEVGASTALRTQAVSNQLDALLGVSNPVPNTVSISGIIDGSGLNWVLQALEANTGADLMSAPKLTLMNGQKSKIRIARELIYPTEYDPPEVPETGDDGETTATTIVPANPTDFETRDVGVLLEVKASATADRRIDLELAPEVTEFQGFINYGGDATTLGEAPGFFDILLGFPNFNVTGTPDQVTVAEGVALTPVFAVRKAETKLQVIDGQTVVMGGFIREDTDQIDDKVPLLGDIPVVGRMFRSKIDRRIKRNLIIFVTARLIKPDGRPEFLTESEKEALELSQFPLK